MWATGWYFQKISSRINNELPVGRNVYDMSKVKRYASHVLPRLIVYDQMCEGSDLCYKEGTAINEYLNRPEIRDTLGVEISGNFSSCSDSVSAGFNSNLDKWRVHTQAYVANLLDRGIRILIYAGTYDWQCNWVANKLWVDKLVWSQSDVYQRENWREWTVDGKVAGEVKETDFLSFVTIEEAGHMMSTPFYETIYVTDISSLFTSPMTNLQRLLPWCHVG
jgi:carboxypeptidase C (cathepsin A)